MRKADDYDVMCTAIEGGIGYWSRVVDAVRDEDLNWLMVTLEPNVDVDAPWAWGNWSDKRDQKPITVHAHQMRHAAEMVAAGKISLRSDIVEWISTWVRSGDPVMIDSDAADCLMQIVCFGDVIYG